jgi:DNA-binding GntR family transcriptional regulator
MDDPQEIAKPAASLEAKGLPSSAPEGAQKGPSSSAGAEDQNHTLVPLSRISKASAIYDIIKEGIISGLWLPGDRINDKELSEKLSVSRISVREALAKLVESQLVERIQWKGFFLRKLTLREVKSIVEIRLALEKLAIKRVMRKKDARLYDQLERSIDAAEAAIKSGNHSEYMATDFRFHDLIHEASGNTWIKSIIGNLRTTINILRNMSMMVDFEEAAYESTADHRRILSAMRSGNFKEAFRSLRGHMKTHYLNIVWEYRKLSDRSKGNATGAR